MGGVNTCECMGCGKQEQFYNCADVAIIPSSDPVPQVGFVPTRPSPTFLTSPESQSREFVERMVQQRGDFPWSTKLLLPHNMMTSSSTNDQMGVVRETTKETVNGRINESQSGQILGAVYDDSSQISTRVPLVDGLDLSKFPNYTSSTINSNIRPPNIEDMNGTTPLFLEPLAHAPTTPSGQILVSDSRFIPPLSGRVSHRSLQTMQTLDDLLLNINKVLGPGKPSQSSTSTVVQPPGLPVQQVDSKGVSAESVSSRFSPRNGKTPSVPNIPVNNNIQLKSTNSESETRTGPHIESVISQVVKHEPVSLQMDNKPVLNVDGVIYQLFNGASHHNITTTPETSADALNVLCDSMHELFTCKATGSYQKVESMDSWCTDNCRANHCPRHICSCSCQRKPELTEKSRCRAVGAFAVIQGMDSWCVVSCGAGRCPSSICDVSACAIS